MRIKSKVRKNFSGFGELDSLTTQYRNKLGDIWEQRGEGDEGDWQVGV